MRIGIAGVGGIGLASAVWLAQGGHTVTLWSPRGGATSPAPSLRISARGLIETTVDLAVAADAAALCAQSDVILMALPVNGHLAMAEALARYLRDGMTVIVSSTASLSALAVYECAQRAGRAVTVAAFGTTTLTARRESPDRVNILTRRSELGVAALPCRQLPQVLALCRQIFGECFVPDANVLVSALANVNPIAHVPLALMNWTRIERGETWPQYHYLTPRVAAVITRLDAERQGIAVALGYPVRSIEAHFAKSFGTQAPDLGGLAAALHAKRGGPPGPADINTRYLAEDVPYGLVFIALLARMVATPTPVTDTMIAMASLVTGRDLAGDNLLAGALGLLSETRDGLLQRVA